MAIATIQFRAACVAAAAGACALQKVFSPSSLNTFDKCPKQYWFRYIAKLPAESEGIEAFVGKLVHKVLERMYQHIQRHRKPPSLPQVVRRFHEEFDAQYNPRRVRIVREERDAASYRKDGAASLENYYRRFYPFDADQTLALEQRVQFPLDGAGEYKVRGFIDRVARAQDGVLEIQDFKTGNFIPGQAALDRDRQLGLYEIGLRQLQNESGPVRLVWHYTLRNTTRRSERTPQAREELRAKTIADIDRIRLESNWETRPTRLCDWCEYREQCPAMQGR